MCLIWPLFTLFIELHMLHLKNSFSSTHSKPMAKAGKVVLSYILCCINKICIVIIRKNKLSYPLIWLTLPELEPFCRIFITRKISPPTEGFILVPAEGSKALRAQRLFCRMNERTDGQTDNVFKGVRLLGRRKKCHA